MSLHCFVFESVSNFFPLFFVVMYPTMHVQLPASPGLKSIGPTATRNRTPFFRRRETFVTSSVHSFPSLKIETIFSMLTRFRYYKPIQLLKHLNSHLKKKWCKNHHPPPTCTGVYLCFTTKRSKKKEKLDEIELRCL